MQDLKSRSDIVDIISSYVNLKRRGKNMVGLCPFHNEKSPSFNVCIRKTDRSTASAAARAAT